MESLYRRPLPADLIPFASPQGRALFREALAGGTMEGYFALAEQFHTQADPAYCGLGSLVVALNALSIDPGRLWKGPWRWFAEELLDCCVPLEQVAQAGLTIDELACLASCNGADANLCRAEDRSADELRASIDRASRDPDVVLIAAYSRSALGQTGSGHFSPLGGYHREHDATLVLDVARFKYPPHWVPVARLHQAMLGTDPSTGRSRGWIELRRAPSPRNLAFVFTNREGGWQAVASFIREGLPRVLEMERPATSAAVVDAVMRHARSVTGNIELRNSADTQHQSAVNDVLQQLRSTAIYPLVASGDLPPELATTLLLLVPERVWATLPPELGRTLRDLTAAENLPEPLRGEVVILRGQLLELERCRAVKPS